MNIDSSRQPSKGNHQRHRHQQPLMGETGAGYLAERLILSRLDVSASLARVIAGHAMIGGVR